MEERIMRKNIPDWFVTAVEARRDYTLLLTFYDGSRRSFDFKSILASPLFRKLSSIDFFMKAHLEGHSVVWDEDTDIASEYLYENSAIIS